MRRVDAPDASAVSCDRGGDLPLRRPLARLSQRSDCAEDDDDAFYLFSQEHKVDRADLPTARETGLRYHLMAGDGAGVERPGGLPWDSVPVRILRLPQERIDPQAKAEILAPLTALWREESPDGCVEVCPLCEAVSGPLMHAVMSCVEEADLRADLSWRRDLGDDVLRGVLLRFEGLAGPLGNNEGVLLEGLRDPFSMGRGALFVNRMTEWDGSSLKSGSPEITKAGGMRLHLDELLLSMANRLMELWKMAAKTQANGPGVTSLGWYDKKYDEIVLVEALYGMRVRGDMGGWNKIPHFVPGGRVVVGGVVVACNFSCTLLWRFSLTECFGGPTMLR